MVLNTPKNACGKDGTDTTATARKRKVCANNQPPRGRKSAARCTFVFVPPLHRFCPPFTRGDTGG